MYCFGTVLGQNDVHRFVANLSFCVKKLTFASNILIF